LAMESSITPQEPANTTSKHPSPSPKEQDDLVLYGLPIIPDLKDSPEKQKFINFLEAPSVLSEETLILDDEECLLSSFLEEPFIPNYNPGASDAELQAHMKAKLQHQIWQTGLSLYKEKLSERDQEGAIGVLITTKQEIYQSEDSFGTDETSPARQFPRVLSNTLVPKEVMIIKNMQAEAQEKMNEAIQTLEKFCQFGTSFLEVLTQEYTSHIAMINEMKTDIEKVFIKISEIKSKLPMVVPK